MGRTRSEYVLIDPPGALTSPDTDLSVRLVRTADRESLVPLLLDAYRGTVDDEGEGLEEAAAAIDFSFATIEWQHSVVYEQHDRLIAMSFVVTVGQRPYIDPVATISSSKGRGIGRAVVLASLRSLAASGVQEVGAVITDGNRPSERLFTSLGFVRVGTWG